MAKKRRGQREGREEEGKEERGKGKGGILCSCEEKPCHVPQV